MKHVVVIGQIGVGKSTFSKTLAQHLNFKYEEEDIDLENLAEYYKDPKKNAFWFQLLKLNKRFKRHKKINSFCKDTGKGVVQDEGIYEDIIFAKTQYIQNYFDEKQYKVYIELNNSMIGSLQSPCVIIFLDADENVCEERINLRNRECEKRIPKEYLRILCQCYREEIYKISKKVPVIQVNYNKFIKVDKICEAVVKSLKSMSNLEKLFY